MIFLEFLEKRPVTPLVKMFANRISSQCSSCHQSPIDVVFAEWRGRSITSCKRCRLDRIITKILLVQIIDLNKKKREAFAMTPLYIRSVKAAIQGVATFGLSRPQPTNPPIACVWNFTNRCNLKCQHCYQDTNLPGETHKEISELSTPEAFRVVDIIAETGCGSLSFSGGEPLFRSDFLNVAHRASQHGLFCTLSSNGTLIKDHTIAEDLAAAGIQGVAISLDSYEPAFHDEFRGVPGAHAAAIKGLEICSEIGKFNGLIVAMTLTNRNIDDIPDLYDLAMEIGATRFYVSRILPVGRGKKLNHLDVTPEQKKQVLETLAEYFIRYVQTGVGIPSMARGMPYFAPVCANLTKHTIFPISEIVVGFSKHHTEKLGDSASQFFHRFAEYASGCATGLTYFGLSPKGDILPCAPATHVHLGNIIKDGLKNIWLNHPAFKILRNRHQTDGNCGECKDSPICGGCRVTAYGNTGSWLASDSSCPYPLLSK